MPISDFLKKHKRKLLALGLATGAAAIGAGVGGKIGHSIANKQRDRQAINKIRAHRLINAAMTYIPIVHDSIQPGIVDFAKSPPNSGGIKYHIAKRIAKNVAPHIARDVGVNLVSRLAYMNRPHSELKRMELENHINSAISVAQLVHRFLPKKSKEQ